MAVIWWWGRSSYSSGEVTEDIAAEGRTDSGWMQTYMTRCYIVLPGRFTYAVSDTPGGKMVV